MGEIDKETKRREEKEIKERKCLKENESENDIRRKNSEGKADTGGKEKEKIN